ncbi:MAG: alpha/beta hydrolase [Chitinophagaceae bacterium]|nr:alpha/beta hydrolase [Chitinophagaceae bacterium]
MKKSLIKLISTLFPNLVVSYAYNMLTNPQIRKLRPNEIGVLDKSEKDTMKFHDFDIRLYTWKGGEDKVLLVHGWEGQAGNFSDLIEELIAHNYTVYAFDAPSHGFSSKGKTSFFQFAELVGILIRKYEVKKLVSHSFGGVAVTYALYTNPDLAIDKYVLLTVPDKFTERMDDVFKMYGITQGVKNKLIARLEDETGLDIRNTNVSEFVKSIKVGKALIIHDKDDTVIPIYRSKNVQSNWKNAELVEVSGTGHFRILRTKPVIGMVVEFFKNN